MAKALLLVPDWLLPANARTGDAVRRAGSGSMVEPTAGVGLADREAADAALEPTNSLARRAYRV